MRWSIGGIGQQADPIGLQPIGDPHLAAIDDIIPTIRPGARADGGDIRARPGFGDADGNHHLASDRRRQIFRPQRVAAMRRQRRGRHVRLDRKRHADALRLDMAERFAGRNGVGEIEPRAAEGNRLGDAEQPEATGLAEHLTRGKRLGRLPFVNIGINFARQESANRSH